MRDLWDLVDEDLRRPRRRAPAARPASRLAWLTTSIAVLVASVAVAESGAPDDRGATAAGNSRGEAVEIQVRNRSKGETGLVTSSDKYSLRLSNTKESGGGGAVYGCRAQTATPAEERACLYADNLRAGEAFLFRSREGTTVGHFDLGNPAGTPFTTNATGLVTNLNADRLDNLHATDIITQARTKAGLAAETADTADTLDGIDSSGFLAAAAATNLARAEESNTAVDNPLLTAGESVAANTIESATGSFVLVMGHVTLDNDAAGTRMVECDLRRLDGPVILANGSAFLADNGLGAEEEQIALMAVDALPASGTATYSLFCNPSGSDGEVTTRASGLVLVPLQSAEDDTTL